MVKRNQHEFRKRDLLATGGLWLISLILPDPHLPYKRELIKKRDFFFLAVLLLSPVLWPGSLFLMGLAGIYAIVALGLSLFLGYAGQISLGHAAFFGIGAYTFAILTTRTGVPSIAAFGMAGVAATVAAYLIGKPILKLKGYFLALATLGFGEIFLVSVREARDLTGGVSGISGVPWFTVAGFAFDTPLKQYCLIWGVLICLILFAKNLVRSKVGRALLAVAASEDAAASVGINVPRIKLGVFVISALFAGLAGSLFAGIMSTASPDAFGLNLSVLIVMMVIMGGMGTLYGPIVAAVFLTWLTDTLGAYQEYSLPIFGVVLILLLIFFPDGVGTRLNSRLIYLISYWGRKRRRERVDT